MPTVDHEPTGAVGHPSGGGSMEGSSEEHADLLVEPEADDASFDEPLTADGVEGADPDAELPADSEAGQGAATPMVPIDADEHPARSWQLWVSWAVVALCSAFVFFSLDAGLLLQDSTPTGGDMGAHVWGPAFLQENLLTDLRVTGWTQDWYAGFPAYVFYMVVPSLFIVWISAGSSLWDGSTTAIVIGLLLRLVALGALVVGLRVGLARLRDHWARPLLWVAFVGLAVALIPVPYNVAFKLVSVSGLVTLPIAVYVLARAARRCVPRTADPGDGEPDVHLRPRVHHPRRQRRLDDGRGVRILHLAHLLPAVPRRGDPWIASRARPGTRRRAARV